ncbi:MAG: adenylosuccinate synthase [Clostridiales bacterium GWF2_36_10]|nr:MAG: adenylosuccinate synthase [Clostridiales bacterium GWF2_36_10]HAN20104.1 adenylosuccinate synthase [Clostridiales bacterium]
MVTAIVGGNWGDEGKGKMTDLLVGESDIVIRFQGGANAGHTIINEYGKFVLHILPSGVFRKNVVNIIASGVALNLDSLFNELDILENSDVPIPNLIISDRAQIVMPYHILFDKLEEERLGANSFGSTKSGIAPFYSDKFLKIGFQVSDIYDDNLKSKLEKVIEVKNIQIKSLYKKANLIDTEKIYEYLLSFKDRLAPYIKEITYYLHSAVKDNKKILLEGQLGALRDPDNGIYPFVTSSSPLAGFGAVGAGLPSHSIKEIITVVKAYSSCVGAGTFVSEIFGEEADELRSRGGDNGEYGATTGRPRRMGWFDVVASRYGCILQGTTQVALSLLDVLGYLKKIPVCIGYEIDGIITDKFPITSQLNKAKPVYTNLDGWECNISGIRKYNKLPNNTKKYIKFIEEKLGFPITMISNGPKREDIIYR